MSGSATVVGGQDTAQQATQQTTQQTTQQQTTQQTTQQTQAPWFDGFKTPEVKELMKTKNYADPEALGVAYFNLNKLQNGAKDVIAIPGENAKPEDWDKLFTTLGRPENADKYDLKFETDMTVEEPFLKFAKGLFFDMGLDGKRAQKAADKWQGYVKERMTAMAEEAKVSSEKELGELKTKWGDTWDANVAAGQKAVKGLGLSDDVLSKLDGAIGFPAVMQLIAAVGKGIGKEDTTIINNGPGGGLSNAGTPEQARVEIARLGGEKEFQDIVRNKNHPQHGEKLKQWEQLHAAAYPPVKRA